jgi:VanZ family protein
LLAVAGTLGVLVLTHIPPKEMPVSLDSHDWDKLFHALVYGVLAFLYMKAFHSFGKPVLLIVIVVILGAVAGLDEYSQFSVGRTSSVMDFLADMAGICCALFLRICIPRSVAGFRNKDAIEAKLSPLSQPVSIDGKTVQVDIYEDGSGGWILEILDELNISTVWDDPFETDSDALTEAKQVIKEGGFVINATMAGRVLSTGETQWPV